MVIETKEIKHLAGAILSVEIPKEKVGKGPFFTGSGFSVPSNKAEHVITMDHWDHSKDGGKVLGVGITYSEKFGGYLPSSNPKELHPSFNGKNLQQILNYYIDNKNNVVNKKAKVISKILEVGYVPLKNRNGSENDQKDYLSTDIDYGTERVYLTLEQYVEFEKPKLLTKRVILEPIQEE